MKKILITGVAGFIGSKIAEKFINEGFEVIGVDDLSSGKIENIPKGLDFLKIDLSDSNILKFLPNKCDLVLHLAGQSSGEISFDNPVTDLKKNTLSTLNLIKYGIENKSEKFIYASSMSVYGNVPDKPIPENFNKTPLSCYGVGKLASEHYLEIFKNQLPFINFRMFNVYGPGQDMANLRQGMVSIFLSQALKENKIHVKGSLDRFRDFIYIDDVVDIWYEFALNKTENISLNLGTGIKTSLNELITLFKNNFCDLKYYSKGKTPGDQKGIYPDIGKLKSLTKKNKFIKVLNMKKSNQTIHEFKYKIYY